MNSAPPATKKNLTLFFVLFSDLPGDSPCTPPLSFKASSVIVVFAAFIPRPSMLDLLTLHFCSADRLRQRIARLKLFTSSDHHKDGRHKEKRSAGGENQTSNHGSTQRSVLLTSVSQA